MGIPIWARLAIGGGVAATLAYMMTPVAIAAARRFAFFDTPSGYKGHAAPTPYLGGAAVMLAFALALVVGAGSPTRTLPLIGGVGVLFVIGTIDDRRTVSWWVRVAFEFALGALVSAAGLGWHLGAGGAVDAATMGVWVIAVVNAFNLFDNMDGTASTMAFVVAAAACVLGLVSHNTWVAAGSAALCGACLGFLPHNLTSPPRIFLGDGGSMPLGFAIAALVANAARSAEPSMLGLLVGFLLVGIPALDTCLVIISRWRRGVSILTGGQDHLTHRARERVRTARRVVLVMGSAQALVSALVIVATREGSTTLVYVLLAFVVAAATTIGALESAAERTASASAPSVPVPAAAAVLGGDKVADAALFALGLLAGISPLFSAFYDSTVWVPIGLGLVVVAAATMIARPPRLTRPAMFALAAVAGLGLGSLLSGAWAAGVEQSTIEANRWLAYTALLLLLFVLLRRRRQSFPLLLGAGVGIGLVAAILLVRMLGSDGPAQFLSGRLDAPLGYINGEGCVFAMGCWLALALAERRKPVVAGLGLAATVVFACLALMSESRGAAIATGLAILVALVAIPGVRRRLLALAAIAGGLAAAAGPVTHVYSVGVVRPIPPSVVHSAATAILVSAAVAGLVWGLLVAAANRVEAQGAEQAALLRRIATAAAICVVAVPAVAGAAKFSTIERTLRTQWHAFVRLSEPSGSAASAATQSRLFTGGGNRYDYWRVAWHVFTAHPIAGVGAGNYPAYYFRNRHTQEAIQNPHSLELQTLSELGVVGGLILALLFAALALGIRRFRTLARGSPAARTAMVAATGMSVVWLVDSSGDWMEALPGVTAIALCAIAVLCQVGEPRAQPVREGVIRSPSRMPLLIGAAGIAFVLAVAGASLLRTGLTQVYLDDARAELRAHPAAAIVDAGRAVRLDRSNLDAYYVKAAGLARFNRASEARATLLAATRQDPGNFVTWWLLGDLEVRLRNFSAAKTYYGHAHRLDPTDPALTRLAANPAAALSGASAR